MSDVEIKTMSEQKILWLRITATTKIIAFSLLLFAVPLLLSWPQLLVGSIVNFLLMLAAIQYKDYKIMIPLVMLPSIAAVMHGVMFWSFSIFLVYMMPAIWLGNFLLVRSIHHLKSRFFGILIWWIAKVLVIFLITYILTYFWILPGFFLKTMGMIQIFTFLIGWTFAYVFIKK